MNERTSKPKAPPPIAPSAAAPAPAPAAAETLTGLVVNAVFDIQSKLGKQERTVETLNGHYMEQREDIRTLERLIEVQVLELKTTIKSMNRTMYAGWVLLVTIGSGVGFTIYRVWEVLLPFLQMKLGLPTH
jgi:hypothetical protein